MSNSFIPSAYQARSDEQDSVAAPLSAAQKPDRVGSGLIKISQYLIVAFTFLLPIVFVPGLPATLGFDKVLLAAVFSFSALILTCLAALRFRSVSTVVPLPLLLFWAVVVAAFASGLLSGDRMDAIRGSVVGPQTATFLALMALVMTLPLLFQKSKVMALYFLTAFASGFGLVLLYSVVRFFAGPVMPFGSFPQLTSSPVGGLNDLAVLSALSIVVGLITLLQLPLKRWMKAAVVALLLGSLITLMVANFFWLWVITGFFSLLFLIYILSRDTLFGKSNDEANGSTLLLTVISLLVCIVSALFVVAGDFAGARISSITGVNYIEVRPSMGATMEIMRSVYQEDILLGSGPNRFADSWRMYKDPSINQTDFWNVNFESGFGYIPTLFVTLGLLGGILLIAFHLSYLLTAYKALFKTSVSDPFWFYVGTTSFASAIVLWGISYIFVPSATVLLVTALFTGLSFASYQALVPEASRKFALAANRRLGLLFMAVSVVAVVLSVSIVFVLGKQYTAQSTFANGLRSSTNVSEFEASVQRAYQLYQDERFLNTLNQLKVREMQALLTVEEPSEEDRARFAGLAQQTISLSREAIQRDGTSPFAFSIQADIYNLLDRAGLEGARDLTMQNIAAAEERDPLNPTYKFSRAVMAATEGNYEAARQHIGETLSLKSNFTSAFFLLAQIAIEEGDVETAIASTRQVVSFEPNNPTRYYQLGILLAANEQYDEAITAYQAALQIDPQYANARYLMALSYAAIGNTDEALAALELVQQSNQDNEQLQAVINELRTTGSLQGNSLGLEEPVEESSPAETTEDGVVSSNAPDTDLITPVNTEPATSTSQEDSETE